MEEDQRIEFLYNSIEDIQNTIRSIDNKILGVFFILILPISIFDDLLKIFEAITSRNQCIGVILSCFFFMFWGISLYYAFRTILAIGNPVNHIKGEKKGKGYFYGASLYDVGYIKRQKNIKSKFSLSDYTKKIKEDWDLVDELTFEQMKIVYIRDLKMTRQQRSIFFLALTIIFGLLSWFISYKIY